MSWIIVEDGKPGRRIISPVNAVGLKRTYSDLRLWPADDLAKDGIYQYREAPPLPADEILVREELVIEGCMVTRVATGKPRPRTPPSIEDCVVAVQAHLDAEARKLGYDDIKSAVTYAEEPTVPKFQSEGQAFRAWRSLVWDQCYSLLTAVESGQTSAPATPAELLAGLPSLNLSQPV